MGNPAILPGITGDPIPPPRLQVLWRVYRLRDRGEKLPRDAVLRTGQTGFLQIRAEGAELVARLLHPSGYPVLDSLREVRLARQDVAGMVLHGSVLSVKSGTTSEIPQAWWCLVASAAPVDGV